MRSDHHRGEDEEENEVFNELPNHGLRYPSDFATARTSDQVGNGRPLRCLKAWMACMNSTSSVEYSRSQVAGLTPRSDFRGFVTAFRRAAGDGVANRDGLAMRVQLSALGG